jgi:hypothetical protein
MAIVDEHANRIIWTGPHTGSGNIHKALCALPQVYWQIGPTPGGENYDHHTTAVGAGHRAFRTFAIIRDPFDRLLGLHRHYCWSHIQQTKGQVAPPRLAQFVDLIVQDKLSWFWRYTLSAWLGETTPDEVIPFEHLAAEIDRLYPNAPLAPAYDVTHMTDIDLEWTRPAARKALQWAKPDLDRFGYTAPDAILTAARG